MENINFELYRVFSAVAKYRNMTKAANELYISQPAITQAIQKLEDQLGYQLFYRTKKGMDLTEAGEILYDYLKIPIECLGHGKEKIIEHMETENPKIRIGSGTTLLKTNVLPHLKTFQRKYPDLSFEIDHNISCELLQKVKNDLLDMVVLKLPQEISENMKVIPIDTIEESWIALKATFPELANKTVATSSLNQYPLILQADISSSRKYLEQLLRKHHITLLPSFELASYSLVADFVKEGLGIGLINKKHIKKELRKGVLIEVKTDIPIPTRQIGVIVSKKAITKPLIRDFIEELKEA